MKLEHWHKSCANSLPRLSSYTDAAFSFLCVCVCVWLRRVLGAAGGLLLVLVLGSVVLGHAGLVALRNVGSWFPDQRSNSSHLH